ncbi:hypothetical protein ACFFX0_02910 [Citricoccus parietis]|uniref:Uncharacterized protein n=1 Tax=Citricoccus parietis TaxID=592307 RepID=A0ABV5FU51_9MICC
MTGAPKGKSHHDLAGQRTAFGRCAGARRGRHPPGRAAGVRDRAGPDPGPAAGDLVSAEGGRGAGVRGQSADGPSGDAGRCRGGDPRPGVHGRPRR